MTPDEQLKAFLVPLLERNPSGSDWLPSLLHATATGSERFGEIADAPSWLHADLTVPALEGRRTCFQYPVAPPQGLVAWFLQRPQELTWPEHAELSTEARLLRRALIYDEPAGARAKAQERARDLIPIRSAFAREWWRFEETHTPDCVLRTDRLALTFVAAADHLAPVSPWYPARSVLHRALEAAERVAAEERAWGTIVLSDRPLPGATPEALAASLVAGAPHRDAGGRAELVRGFLGNLTWDEAAAAAAAGLAAR